MNLIYNLNPGENLFDESSNSLDFCKASQKISQKQIEEFRQTVESKENIPSEINISIQKVRKSLAIINMRGSDANIQIIEDLKKQLKECSEKLEEAQTANSQIFARAEKILINAQKNHKRENEIRDDRFLAMEEIYKKKLKNNLK